MNGSANGIIQTANDGTSFVPLATRSCRAVKIYNDTGTDLEIQQDGTGTTIVIYDGMADIFEGIVNANQLAVRRVDTGTSQVNVRYRWQYR